MFPLAARVWNGFTSILPRLLVLNGRFFMSSFLRPHKAVNFVRFYHDVHLNEDDMEENFIKGWGKGGQKVNKSNNCVHLKHKPTGIIVKCHESRSLSRNRAIARELMKQKLDFLYNGKDSELAQIIAKKKKKKANYARKRRLREEAITTGLQKFNMNDAPAGLFDQEEQ